MQKIIVILIIVFTCHLSSFAMQVPIINQMVDYSPIAEPIIANKHAAAFPIAIDCRDCPIMTADIIAVHGTMQGFLGPFIGLFDTASQLLLYSSGYTTEDEVPCVWFN